MKEIWYYVLVLSLSLGLLLVLNLILKTQAKNTKNWLYKGLSLFLFAVFFVRYLSADSPFEQIISLQNGFGFSQAITALCLVLNWLNFAAVYLLMLYPFFKIKMLDNLVKFFALPVILVTVVVLQPYLTFIAGDLSALPYRSILSAIEIATMLTLSIQVFIRTGFFKMSKKEIVPTLLSVLGMIICTMPVFTLQALFGYASSSIEVIDLNIYHRLFLYAAFLIPLTIWFFLHNKNEQTRHFALLFLGMATMFTFMIRYKFDIVLTPSNWPIHLCHTAMFLVPITLVFKTQKLFYFTFFINVLGAFLAMAMPNYHTQNIFGANLVIFWTNHFIAFFLPLLVVALKIYPRPKLKQFIYSTIAFTVYFVFILIINAWFSNFGTVDFFFVNSDFIAEKLGRWAENLRNITWVFYIQDLTFTFYPLYQFLFYLVYVVAAFAMWFIYEQVYVFSDQLTDMAKRNKQLKMDQFLLGIALQGRGIEEPMSIENANKLVLKNFSKRYGNSDSYAVKNANLEVCGGEIFGFLGPNGAGKSTIIKSIVGIQPITSGSIEVCGFDVDKQSVMAKKQIGFVPDHYALYEKLTGREYINYIADLYEVKKADRDERIAHYVKTFELEQAFDNQMKTYSHGMKQKIAIMSALVHNPKIWILDEPLTGLDPTSIYQVKEAMKQHAQAGNIVFFSSHIIDVVERVCDRIAIIKKGTIQNTVSIAELNQKGILLEDFYLKTIGETKKQIQQMKDEKPAKKTRKNAQPKKAE